MASEIGELTVRWGMVIDVDKCTGCGSCMVSCQAENNVALEDDFSKKYRAISWIKVDKIDNGKSFPEYDEVYMPRPCMQCENPPCVPVCPVVATEKGYQDGGFVSQIAARCIGCRYCMVGCPYGSRAFNWKDPVWPEGMENTLTPHASTRMRGTVEKCTYCHHRYTAAREKARINGEDPNNLAEDAYVPACVETCPSGALKFGDLNNEEHEVYKLSQSLDAFRLLEKAGAKPQLYFMSKKAWVREMADYHIELMNKE
ncbi:MAG: 4Fe-4S dicluster domain-containing protein [Desulfovibrionaceae bacterium]